MIPIPKAQPRLPDHARTHAAHLLQAVPQEAFALAAIGNWPVLADPDDFATLSPQGLIRPLTTHLPEKIGDAMSARCEGEGKVIGNFAAARVGRPCSGADTAGLQHGDHSLKACRNQSCGFCGFVPPASSHVVRSVPVGAD
jgi:hypothetical protein